MESVDHGMSYRGSVHPSSPDEYTDSHQSRHFSNGSGGPTPPTATSATGTAATATAAVVAMGALSSLVSSSASKHQDATVDAGIPEEGELDQFDIVLQQDAAASTAAPATMGSHSPSGATPPLSSAAGHLSNLSPSSYGSAPGHRTSGAGTTTLPLQNQGKRLPSVADACQVSAVAQDRGQCARLIHQLASVLRHEANLHDPSTSPGGDPRATSSPAMQAYTFEEDLSFLTGIVLEANYAHNPQWQPDGNTISPVHSHGTVGVSKASPRGQATVGGHVAPSFSSASRHQRSSPAGANNNGRATIDTEVCDSLCRLSNHAGGAHQLYVAEHETRPMNPCNGLPASSSPSIARSSQSAPWSSLMYHSGGSSVGYVDRSTSITTATVASSSTGPSTSRKQQPQGSGARSTSATVKHPRAVKPEPRNELAKTGRIRGPRSQTGKNVAPSNHSAFSECSGGETRSCRSTLTGVYRNIASSVNVTTNTSVSSTGFNHGHQGGNHEVTINASGGASSRPTA